MDTLTREERIKEYAYKWYEFRKHYGKHGSAEQDWEKAVHMVDAEDKAMIIEADDKLKHMPSRMRC